MNKMLTVLAIAALAGSATAQNARPIPRDQGDTRQRGQFQDQNTDRPARAPRGERGGDHRGRILERFDADGDGELSETERAAARSAMEERRAEMRRRVLERFDADGDGQLSEDERQAARRHMPQRGNQAGEFQRRGRPGDAQRPLGQRGQFEGRGQRAERRGPPPQVVERFDTDGDGELDEAERRAAHEHFLQMRAERAGEPGAFRGRRSHPIDASAVPPPARRSPRLNAREVRAAGQDDRRGRHERAAPLARSTASPSSSPSTARTRPATTSGTSTGRSTGGPTSSTSSSTSRRPTSTWSAWSTPRAR
jgi:hypothetical protein